MSYPSEGASQPANEQEQPDVEYLRYAVSACLRADIPSRDSALADMQTRRAKGGMVLKPPSGSYSVRTEDGVEFHRKPAHGQWTNTVHATPTRAPGFSRETITPATFAQAKYVRAIWSLSSLHIQSILARYSPSTDLRRSSCSRLSVRAASRYRTKDVRHRARFIARAVLEGRGTSQELRRMFVMTQEEWRASRHRKMLTEITAWLAQVDAESLLAWEAACEACT